MALKQNIIIEPGMNLSFKYPEFSNCTKSIEEVYENAYIKIDNINGNKNIIFLDVGIYNEKDGMLIYPKNFSFKPDVSEESENFIKQGYKHLKLNEYKNSIDC